MFSDYGNPITVVLSYLNLLFNYIFLFILILFMAFILIESRKRTSTLKLSYISMFLFACCIHSTIFIIVKISETLVLSNSSEHFLTKLKVMALWYHSFNTGFSNTMLTLNQITALLFTAKYHSIWRPYITFIVIGFTFVYPFLINFSMLKNSCFLTTCRFSSITSQLSASLHTCINAIFSLFLLIITIYIIRKRNFQNSTNIQSFILFQSVFGSIILVIYSLITIIAINRIYIKDFIGYNTLITIAEILHILYYIFMLLIVFIMNPTLRNSFAEFYHCHIFNDVYEEYFKHDTFKNIEASHV